MSETLVAGVDSSTQSCKIVVCEADTGRIVRAARAAHPDGTEVSATAWLEAFREASSQPGLLDGVRALAVGGQQHGMVRLDAEGEPVRDALLWNDNRSAADAVEQTGPFARITLTGGAAQSAAVRQIALAVFGVPVAATEPFESVAVGAARQAAWAFTGSLPDWPVPYASDSARSADDQSAAARINARYSEALAAHFGIAPIESGRTAALPLASGEALDVSGR